MIVIQNPTQQRDLPIIADADIEEFVKTKLEKRETSALVSSYIHTACVKNVENTLTIFGANPTESLRAAATYFEKFPPLNDTEALFLSTENIPIITAIKDLKNQNYLGHLESEDISNSLKWTFLKPIEITDLNSLMTVAFQCTESTLKLILWMENKVVKLFSYDIGALMAIFIPEYYRNLFKTTGKSLIWFWLMQHSWYENLKEKTTMESFVDKIWKVV